MRAYAANLAVINGTLAERRTSRLAVERRPRSLDTGGWIDGDTLLLDAEWPGRGVAGEGRGRR